MQSLRDERNALKGFLEGYYKAIRKRKQLENRLRTARENMRGFRGMGYSLVPRSQTNKVSSSVDDEVLRIVEIEEKIKEQHKILNEIMNKVLNVIAFLPVESTERLVLEYRYIDCVSWKKIESMVNMTRTPCVKYLERGIDLLLDIDEVREIIKE